MEVLVWEGSSSSIGCVSVRFAISISSVRVLSLWLWVVALAVLGFFRLLWLGDWFDGLDDSLEGGKVVK